MEDCWRMAIAVVLCWGDGGVKRSNGLVVVMHKMMVVVVLQVDEMAAVEVD